MTDPHEALTRQLLEWLAERPRTRDEVIEAWRSSCPRQLVWEDALADRLVQVTGGTAIVTLTPSGTLRLGN